MVVDLDGSLLRSDMLLETIAAAARGAPQVVLLIPLWLLSGRAHLKARLAERASVREELLPYRTDVVEWLASERGRGRRIVLATASNERVAHAIANHLALFDEVIASRADRNLKGDAKRDALVERFGEGGFDYAGDGPADVPVWRSARRAILLRDAPGLKALAGRDMEMLVPRKSSRLRVAARALRLHQWTKNLLVLVPLLAAHKVGDAPAMMAAGLAVLAFSLVSSAVYLVNDLADLEADRLSPYKRTRPFASGELGLGWGIAIAPALLLSGLALAWSVRPALCGAIAAYAAAAMLYTLVLKRVAILDVIILAGLYTVRIFAGALAVTVPVSQWLLAFSAFIFLSLALAKRHAEIRGLGGEGVAPGRGYRSGDLGVVAMFGVASGFMSLVILALYVSSSDVSRLYAHPALLWLVIPVMLYWIARVWLLAWRGELHEDPIVFALRDLPSYAAGAALATVVVAAAWPA